VSGAQSRVAISFASSEVHQQVRTKHRKSRTHGLYGESKSQRIMAMFILLPQRYHAPVLVVLRSNFGYLAKPSAEGPHCLVLTGGRRLLLCDLSVRCRLVRRSRLASKLVFRLLVAVELDDGLARCQDRWDFMQKDGY
jgi:hypothetical protein